MATEEKKPKPAKLPEEVAKDFTLVTDKSVIVVQGKPYNRTINFNIITKEEAEFVVDATGSKYLKAKRGRSTEENS